MDNINSTHLVYPIVFKLCKFKLLTGGRRKKFVSNRYSYVYKQ